MLLERKLFSSSPPPRIASGLPAQGSSLRRARRPRHQANTATASSTAFTAVLMPSLKSSCEEEIGCQEFLGPPETPFCQAASKALVWPLCSRCYCSCLSSCSKPLVKQSMLLLDLPRAIAKDRPVLHEGCWQQRPLRQYWALLVNLQAERVSRISVGGFVTWLLLQFLCFWKFCPWRWDPQKPQTEARCKESGKALHWEIILEKVP